MCGATPAVLRRHPRASVAAPYFLVFRRGAKRQDDYFPGSRTEYAVTDITTPAVFAKVKYFSPLSCRFRYRGLIGVTACRYLTSLDRETKAFKSLIEEKARMTVPVRTTVRWINDTRDCEAPS